MTVEKIEKPEPNTTNRFTEYDGDNRERRNQNKPDKMDNLTRSIQAKKAKNSEDKKSDNGIPQRERRLAHTRAHNNNNTHTTQTPKHRFIHIQSIDQSIDQSFSQSLIGFENCRQSTMLPKSAATLALLPLLLGFAEGGCATGRINGNCTSTNSAFSDCGVDAAEIDRACAASAT